MNTTRRTTVWLWLPFLALTLLSITAPDARAQLPEMPSPDWLSRESSLPRDLELSPDASSSSAAQRANRIRLFRMMPGFLSDPVGLDQDDGTTPDGTTNDSSLDWIQVAIGNDNPFFDIRRPGDPGGVGYYRVHTQVQLFDSYSTGLSVGLQAVTPAGLEAAGISDGPTTVSPAIALFHCFDDGTAVQGFVGKHVNLNGIATGDRIRHSWQYGVAVHRPLGTTEDGLNNVYLFVEALGRYRYDTTAASSGTPCVWEVLPGLQLKMSENWWISGGFVLPVNSSTNFDPRLWQITCAIQF